MGERKGRTALGTQGTKGPVRVSEVGPGERPVFDAFVGHHPAGSVLQSWTWGELRGAQHWDAHRLLALDGAGAPCGAALALCRQLPIGGSLLYLARGPVLDYRDGRVLDAMVAGLRRLGGRYHAILCKIDPPVTPPDPVVGRALRARGFIVGHRRGRFGGLQPRRNVIVPLDGGAEAVLARCHGKTRYNIRLAVRRGVTVRRGGREDLATFHRLLMRTCARNGFAERTLPYFQQVWDHLAAQDMAELHLAELEGEAVAAGMLFCFGRHAVYAYGASGDAHREAMAPYAVQWSMIQRACARGCLTYDMTGVPMKLEEGEPAYGLYRFKRGFWPEITEFQGEMDLPLQPSLYRLWRLAEPAWWGGQVWVRQRLRSVRALGAPGPADGAPPAA